VLFIMYSIAMSGIGMLSHTGNNLAMDAFGPISDNAGGIAEICKDDFASPRDRLRWPTWMRGNTTRPSPKHRHRLGRHRRRQPVQLVH